MTKVVETINLIIPSPLLSALYNGDMSGISDEEETAIAELEEELNELAQSHGASDWHYGDCEDIEFRSKNDVPGMRYIGSDCHSVDVVFMKGEI